MLLKLLVANPPHVGEPAVPQLQPAVGGEHADRLEQIVERRRLDAEQRVARTGEAELLGPVLEDDEQPAIGMRLGDNTPKGTFGKGPGPLDRLRSRGEPQPPPGAPTPK